MRSIFVRVEPTVRLVTDAEVVELRMVMHLGFDGWVVGATLKIKSLGGSE